MTKTPSKGPALREIPDFEHTLEKLLKTRQKRRENDESAYGSARVTNVIHSELMLDGIEADEEQFSVEVVNLVANALNISAETPRILFDTLFRVFGPNPKKSNIVGTFNYRVNLQSYETVNSMYLSIMKEAIEEQKAAARDAAPLALISSTARNEISVVAH